MLNSKIIFLIILIQLIQNQYIKFIFKSEEDLSSDFYFEKLIKTNIKTELKIGSPIQNIPFYIKQNQTLSYISGNKIINHIYDELKSNTYNKISDEKVYYNEYFSKAICSSEKFIFNSKNNKIIETNNLTFTLATNQTKNNKIESAVFGLKIEKYKYNFESDFIYQLKQNNVIKNFAYTFKLLKENEGELIIGEYPHEYNNKYKEIDFLTARFSHDTFIEYWSIDLDKIYINNEIFENNKIDGIFEIEFGVLIGNHNYKNKINEIFFDNLIQDNICFYLKSKNEKYFYYSCNNNVNIKKFPNLKFYNLEMKYFFEFNYNDLFIKIDDYYYFLIVFFEKDTEYWILGRPFLKKFQIVFDQEKKLIGFYKTGINFSLLILILLIIITIILIIYIMKFALKKSKRVKASELTDSFDYSIEE